MKNKILLITIILLAFILRFWRLDSYPALNADEAAIGYNAYSLLQTGKDEHGHSWPVHFQSFNDYKPGLYVYMVIPFVKVLGLNEWAVRAPSALLGVLSVIVIYLLLNELFNNKKLSLISALFLAISPWHIHFSRGGWEVNVATFFVVYGLYIFFRELKNPTKYGFTISLVSFALSLYTYHAARVVVPLLGVGIALIYWREIVKNIKNILIAGVISLIVLLPLGNDLLSGNVLARAAGVGLFADLGPLNRINEQRGEHVNLGSPVTRLLHNKLTNYGLAFTKNWAAHFHGEFLFLTGDLIQRDKVPETGQMYLFDILFLIVGLVSITRNFDRSWKFIIWWLAMAPIAAALTFQAPHALRAQNMVIPLVIVSAFGLTNIIDWLKNVGKAKRSLSILLVLLIVWNFSRYQHMFWMHMSKEFPFSSQYGVKELVNYVSVNGDKYKNIVVTDRYDQPYILFLFYTKYSPEKFQESHTLSSRDQFGFSTVMEFDKYIFESIDFDHARTNYSNSLIVGTPHEINKEANVVKKIYGSNGYEYFDIVAN